LRLAALWLLLAAVYAVTLTIPATATDQYAGDEPHYLLAAKSWSEDGDMDLSNQYAERQYDQIVDKLQRGEYVPDQEIQQARAFVTWRDNRRMAGAVHQRELGKVISNVDRLFRQARVDGLDVGQVLADVSKQGGHPGAVLEAVAARVRDEWKGRYEAEKAAHEATRVRAGLGRAPGGAPAGGAAPRGDLSSVLGSLRPGTDAAEAFVERALKGDLAHLDLAER